MTEPRETKLSTVEIRNDDGRIDRSRREAFKELVKNVLKFVGWLYLVLTITPMILIYGIASVSLGIDQDSIVAIAAGSIAVVVAAVAFWKLLRGPAKLG